jgi:ferredoxin-NADP reductase
MVRPEGDAMTDDWTQTWRQATVTGNREVGSGSRLLQLVLPDALPFPFEPGHVAILRFAGHRHPYTLSQVDPERRGLGILFRVIPGGRLTPALEQLVPGLQVEFSGLHHTPILDGIAPGAAAVVGLATGSGIGPLWGFAQRALAQGFRRPISLYAGYREAEDICLAPELDELQARFPRFRWQPTLSRPAADWPGLRGRLGESVPPLIPDPGACHFHLVGNGAMLAELKAALAACAVPEAQVTSEVFFNYNAVADPDAVRAIAARFGVAPGG